MNKVWFDDVLLQRIEKIRSVLESKAAEYSTDQDKLINFKNAAQIDGESPERSLWGMAKKHLVSVMDLIKVCEHGGKPHAHLIDEKIGDMINYLILLEALMVERIEPAAE